MYKSGQNKKGSEYQGLSICIYTFYFIFMDFYFPIQKFKNIFPNISSVLICPVISPR